MNWCFWTVVLEKTLEGPLDWKEIQPVHPKGNQSWVFIGRTDVEAETLILWLPDVKSWLIGKDPDAGENWGQEEKGMTEDEMVEWHHRLNGCGFGWTLGVGDGQGGLACCSSRGCRVGHDWATELTELIVLQNWSGRELWRILRWVKVYNDLEFFRYDIMELFSSSLRVSPRLTHYRLWHRTATG